MERATTEEQADKHEQSFEPRRRLAAECVV
jgi:hypothetical protein